MIKTNKLGNSTTIKLTKSFYSKKNIIKCLEIYSEFLSAKLEESEKNFRLTILSKDKNYPSEELANEFANYLLTLEKNKQ